MDLQVFDSRLYKLISQGSELKQLLTGFEFAEGPIWHPKEKSLIFNDILGNAIYRWSQATGLKKIRRNSYMANGNAYDHQGRVVTCEHATSRVTRTDFANNGELEILASHYQGKQLNSPNDLVCTRLGMLYFTDPAYGRTARVGIPRPQELAFQGVYRLDPTDLSLTLLVDDFVKPNGICFSTDEKRLYVNDSELNHIRVFDVDIEGMLHNGRVWAEMTRDGIGVSDGMEVDQADNVYCTGPGGIHLFDVNANYLGVIRMPEQTANLTWGDDDLRSLYITASTSIYRLRTLETGFSSFAIN